MPATGSFNGEAVAVGYSIDSRTIQPGELFFAVKGERLDGHDFVAAALQAGAIGAVIHNDAAPRFGDNDKSRLLLVNDTLTALQRLGAAVRRLWAKPLIGVTGSAGKTTTKEIVAHVLSTRHRVLKSQGNLNNQFGMPLQLLKLEPEHEMAVIEMGMSHAGEMRDLAALAEPDCGVVTIVAPVHLEYFDSIAGIARAKYELIESLPAGGIAVLNADDQYVAQFGRDFHGSVVTFGLHKHAAVMARGNIEARGSAGVQLRVCRCAERRADAAAAAGRAQHLQRAGGRRRRAGVRGAARGGGQSLATLIAGDKRGEILHVAGAIVINDCYNSNPKALESMVRALAQIPAQRQIVVAGEMLELGPAGERCTVTAASTWGITEFEVAGRARLGEGHGRRRARSRRGCASLLRLPRKPANG